MSDLNKAISDYISDVRKNLICNNKLKKQIINDFRNSVLDFAETRKITDINEIYAHFGTPEEVARTHLIDADPIKIKNATNMKKVLLTAAIIAIALYVSAIMIALANSQLGDEKTVIFESWTDPDIPSEILLEKFK